MNIKIERSVLLPTLSLVESVVEKQQTLPVLANLYFGLEDGHLTIVGTDLELEISETLEGVDGDNGAFTVSARKVLDICRMLPAEAVINFASNGEKVLVSSGRSRYSLKTLPTDDFPRIEVSNFEERFKISDLNLKRILEKTAFAMAVQDVRYYLNGILFELGLNTLRAIATNGHRLAQSEETIQLSVEKLRQLIIPRKAVAEITRFLGNMEETEITVQMSRNHLKLSRGNTTMITKLIEGKFPEFRSVLETTMSATGLQVNRNELIETLNRVGILTTERFKGVKLRLAEGNLTVSANNPEQEEALEEITVEYDGEPIETGYNVAYLIEAAKAITGDTVIMNFQGNEGICIMNQPGDELSIWLVMPIRI